MNESHTALHVFAPAAGFQRGHGEDRNKRLIDQSPQPALGLLFEQQALAQLLAVQSSVLRD